MLKWPKVLLPPTHDMPFRSIFTHVQVLISFLAAVTKRPESLFSGLVIADPHMIPDHDDEKLTVTDVRAKVPGWDAIVEMQRLYTPIALNRQLYRLGRGLGALMQAGPAGNYTLMPRLVVVLIAAEFNLIPEDNKYYHCYEFKDEDGSVHPNSPLLITVELMKLPALDDGTLLWLWCKFLASTKPEEFEALMGRSEAVNEAVTSLLEFSADEKMRIKAEQRELFLMDQAVRIQYSRAEGEAKGRAEGKAEGLAEGEARGKAEVARSMLASKMPVADIAKFTGLSEAEVEGLAAKK